MYETHKLMHFCDLHLTRRVPSTISNWEICLKAIEREKPNLVVIGGDVIFDDPDDEDDWALACAQLSRIQAPWKITAGNHDVGNSETYPGSKPVTRERLDRFRDRFGADWWAMELGRWKVIGLNNMLFGTSLDDESAQDHFVADHVRTHHGPIALFVHKPLFLAFPSEAQISKFAMRQEHRNRLLNLFEGSSLKLIGSGHCHAFQNRIIAGVANVWAPSTCLVFSNQQHLPAMSAGWMSYSLYEQDGGFEFIGTEIAAADLGYHLDRYGSLQTIPPASLATLNVADARRSRLAV